MKIIALTAQLTALPLRHKVVAAVLMAAVSGGLVAWNLLQPSEYASSSVLSYNGNGETGKGTQGAALAADILSEDVLSASVGPVLFSNLLPARAGETLRNHLTITEVAPSLIRVSWRGPDPRQTQAAAQALSGILASWDPQAQPGVQSGVQSGVQDVPGLPGQRDLAQDPERRREEALLRVTIAMLDVRQAEVSAELARKHGNSSALDQEMQRLQGQRAIVQQRLAESQQDSQAQIRKIAATDIESGLRARGRTPRHLRQSEPLRSRRVANAAAGANPVQSDSENNSTHPYPFAVVERAAVTQPLNDNPMQMVAFAIQTGILTCCLYLAAALWRFRPVRNLAELKKSLAGGTLFVGTIPEIPR